ncbi:ribonuclease H-like domain-containing protein [Tanacetum coccineum]
MTIAIEPVYLFKKIQVVAMFRHMMGFGIPRLPQLMSDQPILTPSSDRSNTSQAQVEVLLLLSTMWALFLLPIRPNSWWPSSSSRNQCQPNSRSQPCSTSTTKHIEIDIHFVRDMVTAGQVRVLHVPSRFQYTDIFTKGLPSALFEEFRSNLSVRPPPASTAGAY